MRRRRGADAQPAKVAPFAGGAQPGPRRGRATEPGSARPVPRQWTSCAA